jgi:hypothetical protein
MRIALCITGLYRNWVNPPIPKLVNSMIKILKPTDVYYHTWTEIKDKNPYDVYHCPEPILDYHPIDDVRIECLHEKFIQYKKDKILHDITANRNKQLLGYADLMSKIPDNYDLIIRARWETIVSEKFDYKSYKEKALHDGPVGFMIRPNRNQSIDDNLIVSKDKSDDWFYFLPDALIFHKKEQFNVDLVHSLHKEKNLLPAEWGWHQILSRPYGGDIHTSVHGGAHIAR